VTAEKARMITPSTVTVEATIFGVLKAVVSTSSMESFKVPRSFTAFSSVKALEWFPEFVQNYLSFKGKCFRHCDKPTSMQVVSRETSQVLGAYVCPDGFVSQVVYFSLTPDMKSFENKITSQVGKENFAPNDVRVGSRHGWELGGNARDTVEANLGADRAITEVYWTRYARTDAQKQVAISICAGDSSRKGCLKLFAHDSSTAERFCPTCK
jgi:hypothetical protein